MSNDDDNDYELPSGYEFIDVGGHKNFIVKIDAIASGMLDSTPAPTVVRVLGNHEKHAAGTIRIVKRFKVSKRFIREYRVQPTPPDILWTRIARAVMSPTRYRAVWEPHLADMRHEHAECMKRGDLRGARMAVIRAHFYSIPSWIWGVAGQLAAGVVRWLRT
jgi:hypothetical protein